MNLEKLQLKELTVKEQADINGGGFFKRFGSAMKQLFCGCNRVEWGNGSAADFYNSVMPKY